MPLSAAAQPTARPQPVRCNGEVITSIEIRTLPPYPNGLIRRVEELRRFTRVLHSTTGEEVVRRFLVLDQGDPCTELRRTESERILRAQPFLADATIEAFADGAGGVRLEVETVDELTIVAGGSVSSESPYVDAVRLGDGNIGGSGTYLAGRWRDGAFYRDEFAASFVDYQIFGRPYQLEAFGARRSLGGEWHLEARHPFFTDLQRIAWRVEAGMDEGYLSFRRPEDGEPALRVHRAYADVGGIVRIGQPGRLSLFGASLSRETGETSRLPVLVTDSGLITDTSTAVIGRYGSFKSARVNALWGVRNISFRRVNGFDALTGPQDVRVGFQLGTLFGRSLSVLGSTGDDIFVSADIYGGYGGPRAFAALQLQAEGRQNYDNDRWEGVLVSGRLATYGRPHPHHTLVGSIEGAAGRRQRVPFQLLLGDAEAGVRGYRDSRASGSARVVIRMEDRWFIGRPRGYGDLGIALFTDVGQVWEGTRDDVPYAEDSPARWSAGVSLLAAVPPRSRQLWRIDLAFPLSPDPHASWEVRFTSRDFTRMLFREAGDVLRSRERTVPSSIFSWP